MFSVKIKFMCCYKCVNKYNNYNKSLKIISLNISFHLNQKLSINHQTGVVQIVFYESD